MAIKLKCKIKAKHNFKNFNQIGKKLPQTIANGVEEVLKTLQTEAIRLEKGHNQEGIIVDKVDLSTGKVKSRVYADPIKFMSNGQSYLWFEYFGTRTVCRTRAYWNNKTFYRKWLHRMVYSS